MNSIQLWLKMDTIFMNSKLGKASDSHRLLSLTGKINLKRIDKYVAFSNLIIYYIWKILESHKKQ